MKIIDSPRQARDKRKEISPKALVVAQARPCRQLDAPADGNGWCESDVGDLACRVWQQPAVEDKQHHPTYLLDVCRASLALDDEVLEE
jgi:hypothetical protein